MLQTIELKLINEKLHIGLVTWREVYIFYPKVIQLNPEVLMPMSPLQSPKNRNGRKTLVLTMDSNFTCDPVGARYKNIS